MTTTPLNLTLIREDFDNPRSLAQIKADMAASPTDYVMVVGENDIVDVSGVLDGGVHYLATHVATRRAVRHSWPVLGHDPLLLTQFNYLGFPILHRSLVPLFPTAAVDPWHTVMVRAQAQGAQISPVAGDHTIVESWPRPERSGAYSRYQYSFDPAAVMEAVPTILVEEINQRPVYSMRDSRAETITAFCYNCATDFIASLAAPNVSVQLLLEPDFDRIRACNTSYVAWFDGIFEAINGDTLNQLRLALEFPGVKAASPHLVTDFTPRSFSRSAYAAMGGIVSGLNQSAWLAQTRDLGITPPTDGCLNTQAILRKIP
jgi:hypothetical protein